MESPHVFEPGKSKYLVITADYLLPFLIIIGVAFLFYFVAFSSFFKIKTVTCSLDYGECQDPSVLAELDKLKGQNIFTLTKDKLESKLTSGDFTIREVSIKKTLPDNLQVELQSVYPFAALKIDGDKTWVVLDPSFKVIATRLQDPNVPTVVINTPLTLVIGKPITDPLLLSALKLAGVITAAIPQVKSIALIDSNTIHLGLDNGLTGIFSPKGDEQKQLRSLQAVLSGSTITKGIKTIDVRFSQPVLRP